MQEGRLPPVSATAFASMVMGAIGDASSLGYLVANGGHGYPIVLGGDCAFQIWGGSNAKEFANVQGHHFANIVFVNEKEEIEDKIVGRELAEHKIGRQVAGDIGGEIYVVKTMSQLKAASLAVLAKRENHQGVERKSIVISIDMVSDDSVFKLSAAPMHFDADQHYISQLVALEKLTAAYAGADYQVRSCSFYEGVKENEAAFGAKYRAYPTDQMAIKAAVDRIIQADLEGEEHQVEILLKNGVFLERLADGVQRVSAGDGSNKLVIVKRDTVTSSKDLFLIGQPHNEFCYNRPKNMETTLSENAREEDSFVLLRFADDGWEEQYAEALSDPDVKVIELDATPIDK